jgi:prepilin signal peptidase PulO-like enzyme (type II secretory pathway)
MVTGLAALYVYVRAMGSPLPLFRLAGVVSLVSCLLLAILWLRGANISLEDRHLRPAGVLLLAAGAQLAGPAQPPWIPRLARAVLLLAVLFGLGATIQRIGNIRHHGIRLENGTSLTGLDPAVLARLRQIDADPATGLVYLPQPELALMMRRARVLPTDAVIHDRAWLAADARAGRVPDLQLVLPGWFVLDGRAEAIRSSFTGYAEQEWHRTRVGDWDFWQAPRPPHQRTK